jgi:Fic-DOC domain mobile mystery protein B
VTPEDIFSESFGSTPLTEEEKEGLIPRTITMRSELNEAEQENILKAIIWLDRPNMRVEKLLTTKMMKTIHGRMFGQVWLWAKQFRRTDKNIGIAWWDIPTQLDSLLADTLTQLIDTTTSRRSKDEIAARFHHRLVQIHPFVNGNGRHARLVTDKFLRIVGEEEFTWGSLSIEDADTVRRNYIHALKDADTHDFSELLRFVRS